MSSSSAASSLASSPRLKSIDVFRGATIAAMVLANSQFSHEVSYRQLAHAAWNGWTFADTIFPGFLFIVGVSLVLSTALRMARGEDCARLVIHAMRRSLLIFACGLVIDYLRIPSEEFPFVGVEAHLQLTGVLQKIAVCYLAAFLIYLWAGSRGVIVAIIGLNLLYLGLLYYFPVPGCGPGSLAASCNFPGHLDEIVLDGFRWNSSAFDPDGVGTLLPAISSVLFGVLAGQLLLQSERPSRQRLLQLLAGGLDPDRGRRIAFHVGANQQAAVDHLVRTPDGGTGGDRTGLHRLARRWPSAARLVQTLGGLGAERDCCLPDLPPRDERASGPRYGEIPLQRRPRARCEPARRVLAVRHGCAGCRLCGGLDHGSSGLASEIVSENPAA